MNKLFLIILFIHFFRYVKLYQEQHNRAEEDVQLYISNPINAYTLVKRLTTDWQQVESLMTTDISKGNVGEDAAHLTSP